MIVYPHRVTFLDRGSCDVCNNKSVEIVHTNINHYYGWETCNETSCNQKIKEWFDNTTIKKDELIKELGEKIYVKRRNNSVEYGWKILTDAHQEEDDGEYWVSVGYKNNTKEVTVNNLRLWKTNIDALKF